MNLPPHVTAYTDRHGRKRYRFRCKPLPTRSLPGEPGQERFQTAYAEALAGAHRPPRKSKAKLPAIAARSLRAAWVEIQRSYEWQQLRPLSRKHQSGIAERFMASPIAPGSRTTFGDMPFDGLRRSDVRRIIARYTDTPHAGEATLRFLRKIALVALDLEWIDSDPTYRVHFAPKLIGHRAWTDDELVQFARHWPVGSNQRLTFALALYTGQRRGDLAALRWTAFDGEGIAVVQEKTGAPLWIPAHPELRAILMAAWDCRRNDDTIIATFYGKQFASCGLGNMFADAITTAGLPDACRLHGLRKSAGRCLAEAGATTRQIMAVLGHKTLSEAERYTAEAEQRQLAQQGMDRWSRPRLVVAN